MSLAIYVDVRHDSKYYDEPIFALQMHALHVGERGYQRNGLRHDGSRTDLSNGFGIVRQFQRHIPVWECVGGPDGHHEPDFGRQRGGVPGIFEENRCCWDIVLDERADDRRLLHCHPSMLGSLIRSPLHEHDYGNRDEECD